MTAAHLAAKRLWHQSSRESANVQLFGSIQRASELLPSCFYGPCPMVLSVICGSSDDGEGAGWRPGWAAACTEQVGFDGAGREVCSAGACTHTARATQVPSLCVTGLRRMEPLLPQRGPGLWCLKLHTGVLTPLLEALCRLCWLKHVGWINKPVFKDCVLVLPCFNAFLVVLNATLFQIVAKT